MVTKMATGSRWLSFNVEISLQKYKKKCSHKNVDCILVMNGTKACYFGTNQWLLLVLIGTAFIAVLSEVPLFELEVIVIVEKMV